MFLVEHSHDCRALNGKCLLYKDYQILQLETMVYIHCGFTIVTCNPLAVALPLAQLYTCIGNNNMCIGRYYFSLPVDVADEYYCFILT